MKRIIFFTWAVLSINNIAFAQSLEDYQKIAAESNPELLAQFKMFEAALQKVPQLSSLPDPNFSFGYFISPVETRVGPQRARFSLTQMFPWFGTIQAQKDAASLLADAKYYQFIDARNNLYYQVAAAYYPLFELQQKIIIEEENIRILESYKNIANVKFQNGNGTMVDVLRVDLMLNDATAELSILDMKRKPLQAHFNTLLNRPVSEQVYIIDILEVSTIPSDFRIDSLLQIHPLLSQLDYKIRANELNQQLAIKQGLPKIGVGVDYVIVSERTDMTLPDNGKDVFMPMVSLSIPIYRTKYKAAIQEAELLTDSYKLQKEQLKNALLSTYEMILFKLFNALELFQLYEQQISESQQSLNLLYAAYSNSGKEFEEVLRMQQQLLKYQNMKASALAEYHIALAEFNYIISKNL